jgi:hypothetical protein
MAALWAENARTTVLTQHWSVAECCRTVRASTSFPTKFFLMHRST